MLKSFFSKIRTNVIFQIITIATVVVASIGVFNVATAEEVNAASTTGSINLIYYGTNSNATDQSIIDANPEYLVDNSPAGPWGGNADISKFMAAGIKYFEYIDGGYEGTVSQAIPNDLQSNLDYIAAIAKAGAYGVFIDEVSAYPSAAQLDYLKQLADYAHSLGLKVVFNVGVDSWSDSLMDYCDFINSSEVWNNNSLTASQIQWASRTWFLTQDVNDATTAANLTEAAWSKGIEAIYVCSSYTALPTWLASYITLVESSSTTTVTTTAVTTPTTTTTVAATPTTTATVAATPTTTATVAATPTTTATVAATPTTTTTTAAAPATTTTAAVTTTTTATVVAAPATTTTTAATTTKKVSGNAISAFFSRLWQPLLVIWAHISGWMSI